jgi:glucosamine-6-phosphate deaminase
LSVTITTLESADDVAQALANRVSALIARKPTAVLGLPTGRTPIGAYTELRRMHAEGLLDLAQASTFNLDEFVGVGGTHPGSFRQFMERHLFSGVNLRPDRIQFLNGEAPDLAAECERYERAIGAAGGIDLQILGIGANGHIGFNEPAGQLTASTHRVRLLPSTRRDNAELFGGETAHVPELALTMGVGTIMRAAAVILVATGTGKAHCIERTARGPITTQLPASLLQLHQNVELLLDRAAASRL